MKRVLRLLAMLVLVGFGSSAAAAENASWLGFSASYEDDPAGRAGSMTVVSVSPESPAARAGLRVGDIIKLVNGVAFRFEDWTATVAKGGPFTWAKTGDHVRCTLSRDGKTRMVDLVAAEPPPAIVDERAKFKAKMSERQGPAVFDKLSRQGTRIRVEREIAAGPIAVQEGEGLTSEDRAALSHFLNETRLRVLFSKLEPGRSMHLKLSTDPATGASKVEVVE